MKRDFAPVHPGEILSEEFLVAMRVSQYRLAKSIGVPALRINQIVRGKRSVTVDTGLRLSKYFGSNDSYWPLERPAGYQGAVGNAGEPRG